MGLLLQTAIFPGSDISDAQTAVGQAAREQGIHLDLKACLYAPSVEGTQVLLEGEPGFEGLAEKLSRICCGPVMYICCAGCILMGCLGRRRKSRKRTWLLWPGSELFARMTHGSIFLPLILSF